MTNIGAVIKRYFQKPSHFRHNQFFRKQNPLPSVPVRTNPWSAYKHYLILIYFYLLPGNCASRRGAVNDSRFEIMKIHHSLSHAGWWGYNEPIDRFQNPRQKRNFYAPTNLCRTWKKSSGKDGTVSINWRSTQREKKPIKFPSTSVRLIGYVRVCVQGFFGRLGHSKKY